MKKQLKTLIAFTFLSLAMGETYAQEVLTSAFVAPVYTLKHDTGLNTPSSQSKRFVTVGELNIKTVTETVSTRIDLDINQTSVTLEQALFSWTAHNKITLHGGRMNTPLGQESMDAPTMGFVTNGQIFNLHEKNITGLTADFSIKKTRVTTGLINDEFNRSGTSSLLLSATPSLPIKSLTFNGSYRTASHGPFVTPSPGAAWSLQSTFTQPLYNLGAEFYGDAHRLHIAYTLTGHYVIDDWLSTAVRYDRVSYSRLGKADTTSFSFVLEHNVTQQLRLLMEWRQDDINAVMVRQINAKAILTLGDFN